MHQESGDSRMTVGPGLGRLPLTAMQDRGPFIMSQGDPAWPSPS